MGAFSTYHSGEVYTGSGTFQGVGSGDYVKTRREFLIDQISYKYPSEAPLVRMLPKVPIASVEPEWTLGTLTPSLTSITASAENENFASTPNPSGFRKRAGNYTHIKHKEIEVTDTQRLMEEVGTSDEYQLQVWQKARELTMEVENTLVYSEASAGSASSPNRQTHGAMAWAYYTAGVAGTQTIAGHPIPTEYDAIWKANAGTPQDMVLSDLVQLTQDCWNNGMEVSRSIFMCGDKLYKLISAFALQTFGTTPDIRTVPLNERTIPAAARTLEDWIEVYQGPFGRLHINKNRYFTSRSGSGFANFGPLGNQITLSPDESFLMFEPDQLAIGMLQGMHIRPGATSTLSSVAALVTQFALICRDPRGIAAGTDWTT